MSLSDYYNKLVQVQTSLKIVEALHAEVHHHSKNSVAVLQGAMRMHGIRDTKIESGFLQAARVITDQVDGQADAVMTPVNKDAIELKVRETHLTNLIDNPAQMTAENFDALSAFNDRMRTADEHLRDIRIDTEIRVLRVSGLVSADFTLADKGADFNDYYNKLVQVQMSAKVARALEEETRKRFGPAEEIDRLMKPISAYIQDGSIASRRLIELLMNPEMVTQENFDKLSAFNDRLNTTNDRFRKLQAENEVKLLRERGAVSPDFTISPRI